MRGTLHLMTTKDYLDLRPALQPMLTAGMQGVLRERAQGFDLEGVTATARACLDERRAPSRSCATCWAPPGRGDERAMGYAMRTLLPLIQVPDEGRWGWPGAAGFAVAETWLGRKMEKGGGETALVLRYLAPSAPRRSRCETWSGTEALAGAFETLRPKLVVFRDDKKRELFDLPKAPRPPADTPAPVRFLPDYDNLMLAHADRRASSPKRIAAAGHREPAGPRRPSWWTGSSPEAGRSSGRDPPRRSS